MIFYLMGKSATGKDTIYHRLIHDLPELRRVVLYTTRPMRNGEVNGEDYCFVTDGELDELRKSGRVIESRTYQTAAGPWSYATVKSEGFMPEKWHYLMIGTLESYEALQNYFGRDKLAPLYIAVEDRERLRRSADRESAQERPDYKEVCRRYLADEADFAPDRLSAAGIEKVFFNRELETCVKEIEGFIQSMI